MKYLSVCSGIEAATVAWHSFGWKPVAFSEIERFPKEVLAHHYPTIPNLGDMRNYKEWNLEAIDILVGGTPCQAFSIAGLRKGLDDPRGSLMLTYGALAGHYRPRWLVWENVPGVLSSNGGRDFTTFLGMLGFLGYGFAYRILDAQFFGVAQRRRRVFVVGHLGDWRRAAAVLFESESLRWNHPPSRESRKVSPTLPASGAGTGRTGNERTEADFLIMAHGQANAEILAGSAPALTCNHEAPILAFPANLSGTQCASTEDLSPSMGAKNPTAVSIQDVHGMDKAQNGKGWSDEGVAFSLDTQATQGVGTGSTVRRLTPRECERLQGFPDDYTKIAENTPDGPRYKALGNSMAVPVMAWIGKRIRKVEEETC